MRKYRTILTVLAISLLTALPAISQSVTPDESTVIQPIVKKVGINLNGPSYYGGQQIYKNLIWRNPGFEDRLYRQKYATHVAGTTSTFTGNNPYDPVVANFWSGATFKLYDHASSTATPWCTGTVASNTVSDGSTKGATYTFSAPCSRAVASGDVIVLDREPACTPEADWESGHVGWWGGVSNGGKITSDCAAPYDGAQSAILSASASGASANLSAYIDAQPSAVMGVIFNGTYSLTGYYKTASGTPTFTVSAGREAIPAGQTATGNPMSCATTTLPSVSAWTKFTINCTGNETTAIPGVENFVISFTATGGTTELDNVDFEKTSGLDSTNTSVFRDEVVASLRQHFVSASLTGVHGELRWWAGQNAEDIKNVTKPIFERAISVNGYNYDYNGASGYPDMKVSLPEFLELCRVVGAEPYIMFPETTGRDESAGFVDYLNGNSTTTYGALRIAQGQTASWLSVFPTTHVAMGNENWESGEGQGQGLASRSDAPDFYYDYSNDAAGVFNTARASSSWPANGAGIDLVLNLQDGNPGYGVSEAIARATPNSVEIAPYTQNYVGDASSLAAQWQPLFYEVVSNTDTTNSTTQSIFSKQMAASVAAGVKVNVYEFDNGSATFGSGITQANIDAFSDAAGYGTATALQTLEHMKAGIIDQNFFSLAQYLTPTGGLLVHQWGAFNSFGGAGDSVRPQELGMEMVDAAAIGPMYSCPVANPDTYSLGANTNGYDSTGTVQGTNIPHEYAFCFKAATGTARSMILVSTDVTASHTLALSGAQAPKGAVTMTQYAPSSISAINEATANNYDGQIAPQVAISAPVSESNPSSVVLPPYSITRLDWMAQDSGSSNSSDTPVITTTFNEGANGTFVGGTKPATDTPGNSWNDHAYQLWTYSSNGAVSSGEDDGNALAIDSGLSDYVVTFTPGAIPSGVTGQNPFEIPVVRYVDNQNYVNVIINANGLIGANATIGGSGAGQIATITVADPTQPLAITVQGTTLTIASQGQTASGTIPSGLTGGVVGFASPVTGTTVKSFSVAPIIGGSSTPAPAATTTTLAASSTTPTAGSNVTLTATVSNSAATGTVTFSDAGTTLGTGTVTNGMATYIVSAIAAGSHSYTAAYGGDSNFAASTSSAVSVTAASSGSGLTATTISLGASSNTPVVGSSVTLTAAVFPSSATGTVTFFVNGTSPSNVVGTGTLSNGVATFTLTDVQAGSNYYEATYGGDSTHAGSTSGSVIVAPHVVSTTGLTIIVGDHISLDLSGQPLAAGSWCVQPVNALGQVTGFEGATGKQYLPGVACFPIVNGSIGNAVQLPDTGSASPAIGYRVKITLPNGVALYTYPQPIHPTGSTWSFDLWNLN